jgi:hypothetical protein
MKRIAIALALIATPAAYAHGPTASKPGYVSTVAGLRPNVVGVTARILGSDQQIQITNYSGKTVDVLDAQRKPIYRFAQAGIFQMLDGQWVRIGAGSSYAWHDGRIRWTPKTPPPVVQQEPNKEHRVFAWHIPALANGDPFTIDGFLGYRPALGEEDGGLPAWGIALIAAGATVVLGAGARRVLTRRAPSRPLP